MAKNIYKQDIPGFIFIADGPIVPEMIGRKLFGLPYQMKDIVFTPGQALFLIDPPAQLIYGVFQATTTLTENLIPDAFAWSDPTQSQPVQSVLPMQVKVTCLVEAAPLHIHDPELQAVFRAVGGLPMGGKIELKETKALLLDRNSKPPATI